MMHIVAKVSNNESDHTVRVATEDQWKSLAIAPKASGRGSSINGGELLFAAIATCFCNDLFREAAKRKLTVHAVEVEVSGDFSGPAEPAHDITYTVRVQADATATEINELIHVTDSLTEIQNTLRRGCPVRMMTG